jgi:hypothetical protein
MGFRMRKSSWIAAAILGVLAIVSGLNESGPWAKNLRGSTAAFAQSVANLSGVITDMTGGEPRGGIGDATVSLYSTDRILQTKSDQKGQFEFADVPQGTYILEATRQGFQTTNLGTVQIAGKSTGPFSIAMRIANPGCESLYSISYAGSVAGRTLKGVVLDSQQRVVDAEVSLANVVGARVVASQRSSAKGDFEFANVEPGRYVLRVSHPGYHDGLTEPFWIVRESGTAVVVQVVKLGQMRVCQ